MSLGVPWQGGLLGLSPGGGASYGSPLGLSNRQPRGILDILKSPATGDALSGIGAALLAYGTGNPQAMAAIPQMLHDRRLTRSEQERLRRAEMRDQGLYELRMSEAERARNREAEQRKAWERLFPPLPGGQPGGMTGAMPGGMPGGQPGGMMFPGADKTGGGPRGFPYAPNNPMSNSPMPGTPQGGQSPLAGMEMTPAQIAMLQALGPDQGMSLLAERAFAELDAPKVAGGMFWGGDSFEPIPGYVEQQAFIRAAGRAPAAPPKIPGIVTLYGADGPVSMRENDPKIDQMLAQGYTEAAPKGGDAPKTASAADLRKEYQKATEDYAESLTGYNKVIAAVNDPSPAGDIALIFGYMKTLDPNSTVREGEFATAQQTSGLPGQVVAAYNRAINGERLTPQQRADFAKSAANQFKVYQERKSLADQFYQGLSERSGVAPGDVLMGYPDPAQPAPYAMSPDSSGMRNGTQGVARPKSKAEMDALPPGTAFIAPDGSKRIKR